MADDIDIEEHDVLESLRRRQMPEAVIKTEPVDLEYTDSQYEDPNGYHQDTWDWQPTPEVPQIKVEPEEEIQFGKIILGSKPSIEATGPDKATDENVEEIRPENYNYNMSLVLDDWGPILQRNKCYCPECEILFATVNALDAHKMLAHSFLIATDKEPSPERNKAFKSTAKSNDSEISKSLSTQTCEICKTFLKGHVGRRNLIRHYKNVHKVDPFTQTVQELREWRICNHCNVYFPNDTSLVKHLYELLPLNDNKNTNDVKNTPVKVQSAVKSTTLNDNLKVKTSPVKIPEKNTLKPIPTIVAPVSPIKVKNTVVRNDNRFILGTKVKVKSEDIEQQVSPSALRKCEVCGVEYGRKYYNVHMRRVHPDFLLLKMGKLKKIQAVADVNTNYRYKCNICKLVLNGYTNARNHRVTKHPQTSGQKIFKVIKTNKIQKIKNKPIKLNKVVKKEVKAEENTEIVVPKSTLFKCNRCSVHFMTCYGACAHSRVCETTSNLRDWSCQRCQKVFKNTDKKSHEFQHDSSNSKFRVYVVYLEMVVRILCECPFCYVCFEEYKFWRHINFGCERDAESFYCNECRLPVDESSRASHESKHTKGDFTKDDFIKVDFIASKKEQRDVKVEVKTEIVTPKKDTPVRNLKRKLEEPESVIKRKYTTVESHLFYCPTCKCYMSNKGSFHKQKKCKGLLTKSSAFKQGRKQLILRPCQICGLCFTAKTYETHRRWHVKHPKLNIHDLTFTRITDNKKIKPIGECYSCKKCQVAFLSKMSRFTHACGKTKSIECQECQKKIDKQWFKAHMNLHDYVIPGKVKAVSQKERIDEPVPSSSKSHNYVILGKVKAVDESVPSSTKSPVAQNLPELLMKYKSLTTLWNILYVCEVCDTFTDSYDKVVEHCQNHFSNMESYGVVIMKCQICNMKFDQQCYRRHLELHAGSKVISRKSFKILKYDHAKLYSPDWLNFLDLPDDQKSQILTRSLYGETRSFKLTLLQQGLPEYTVYQCPLCCNCVTPDSITYHINLQNCLKANKVPCSFCNLKFVSRSACEKHEKIHSTKDLKADSFRIIAFNTSKNSEIIKKLKDHKEIVPDVTVPSKPPMGKNLDKYSNNIKTVKGKKFYMFYKCGDCGCCMLLENNCKRHTCCPKKTKTCPKCGLDFSPSYMHIHDKLHDKFNISKANIFTKTFYNKDNVCGNTAPVPSNKKLAALPNTIISNENKKDEAKLYKCHCGLHYTSLKSIEKHYQAKNCSTVVRERCSQCNLMFDPLEVVNHLCKHHAQGQFNNFDIITPTKKTLYKCNQCHVLFYEKRIAALHTKGCDGRTSGMKCGQCGLAFHKSSVLAHRNDHKAYGILKPDCYIVVNVPSQAKTAVLYRCKICDVHFMMRGTIRNHIVVYKHKTVGVKKCNECGLKFTAKTYVRHVELQHRIQKIHDFDIREFSDEYLNKLEDSSHVTTEPETNEEVDEIAPSEPEKEIVEPEKEIVVCQVYKCKKCTLHFTDKDTLTRHYDDRCSKELSEFCDDCNIKFAIKSFKEHLKGHSFNTTVTIKVLDNEEYIPTTNDQQEISNCIIYKCKSCELHFNNKKTLSGHVSVNCRQRRGRITCKGCDRAFTKHSLIRHETLDHNRTNFEVVTLTDLEIKRIHESVQLGELQRATASQMRADLRNTPDDTQSQASNNETIASLDSSFELESTDSLDKTKLAMDAKDKKDNVKVKLYKCGDCNVYFITQTSCYKHTIKHVTMDTKDYIECKLCGFQFSIIALPTHIKRHHASDLNLEDVLVEEYQPNNLQNNVPKIEIYYAIDKYQSRLVSTTSEVKNDANLEELDDTKTEDSEVTSNSNELTDKTDDDQQVIYAVVEENDNEIDDLKDVCSESNSSDVNKTEIGTDTPQHTQQD